MSSFLEKIYRSPVPSDSYLSRDDIASLKNLGSASMDKRYIDVDSEGCVGAPYERSLPSATWRFGRKITGVSRNHEDLPRIGLLFTRVYDAFNQGREKYQSELLDAISGLSNIKTCYSTEGNTQASTSISKIITQANEILKTYEEFDKKSKESAIKYDEKRRTEEKKTDRSDEEMALSIEKHFYFVSKQIEKDKIKICRLNDEELSPKAVDTGNEGFEYYFSKLGTFLSVNAKTVSPEESMLLKDSQQALKVGLMIDSARLAAHPLYAKVPIAQFPETAKRVIRNYLTLYLETLHLRVGVLLPASCFSGIENSCIVGIRKDEQGEDVIVSQYRPDGFKDNKQLAGATVAAFGSFSQEAALQLVLAVLDIAMDSDKREQLQKRIDAWGSLFNNEKLCTSTAPPRKVVPCKSVTKSLKEWLLDTCQKDNVDLFNLVDCNGRDPSLQINPGKPLYTESSDREKVEAKRKNSARKDLLDSQDQLTTGTGEWVPANVGGFLTHEVGSATDSKGK